MKELLLALPILLSPLGMTRGTAAENANDNQPRAVLRGVVRDARTGHVLPSRIYIQSDQGDWYFARSESSDGTAVEYRKQRTPESVEMHTTLSANPFLADLPPGHYTITAERGKEYRPAVQTIDVARDPVFLTLHLQRWIDTAARGWYSGETHVHRSLEELPNLIQAEDLNVALPLTAWVTTANTPPGRGRKTVPVTPRLIEVDRTHVIYPMNTEYEIFSVNGKRHTLGAVFVLNHTKRLDLGVPPVRPVADAARRQGAMLDLDKHSWPWSMMIVPVMGVDLFELSNNHMWRTPFCFRQWTLEEKPKYVELEMKDGGWSEWGWTRFGFQTYYLLLNCGFPMRPSAGTASGVHPVPLGFGRVYVYLPDGFSYDGWIDGLNAGRSFVTNGPMLFAQFNGQPPGTRFDPPVGPTVSCRVTGEAIGQRPLDRIEIIVNGDIRERITPTNTPTASGGLSTSIDATIETDSTSWLAVRCFEKLENGRFRFAHTAPVHFPVEGKPLRPRRAAVEYLIRRMHEELERNKSILPDAALNEYRQALAIYERIANDASVSADVP